MTKRRPKKVDVIPMLEALYAELPQLDCQGLCADSCGPIDMSDVERDRIAKRGVHIGVLETVPGTMDCPALSMFGTCRVYDIRPMICRLWGVAASMPCTHGCQPVGGLLPDRLALDLLARALILGGGEMNPTTRAFIAELQDDPHAAGLVARLVRGDKSVAVELTTLIHERAKEDVDGAE